jgi:hypothetical protein
MLSGRLAAVVAIASALTGLSACTIYTTPHQPTPPSGYAQPDPAYSADAPTYDSTYGYAATRRGWYGDEMGRASDDCECRCEAGPRDPYVERHRRVETELEGNWDATLQDAPTDLLE